VKDALTEIADTLDTLADVIDGTNELAGHNASFWRDAAACLSQRGVDNLRTPARPLGVL
jgi:hypothetical protein